LTQPRYLLDTDIFIHLRRGRSRSVIDRFDRLQPGDAAISVISYGELIYGTEKSTRREDARQLIDEMMRLVPPLALPPMAAEIYGTIRADLERKGMIIGHNDLWIAAHAKAAGLILVTANERELARIPDLTVENWAR
jgi:tRNA(fMet)-specific endonuclease VapC